MYDPDVLKEMLEKGGFKNVAVHHIKFASHSDSVEHMVNGLFLKHPLSREVAAKDPAASEKLADALRKNLTKKFGTGKCTIELSEFICEGRVIKAERPLYQKRTVTELKRTVLS
jgi:hypothetical protein